MPGPVGEPMGPENAGKGCRTGPTKLVPPDGLDGSPKNVAVGSELELVEVSGGELLIVRMGSVSRPAEEVTSPEPPVPDPVDELGGLARAVGVKSGLELAGVVELAAEEVGVVCWDVVEVGLVAVAGAVSDTESRAGVVGLAVEVPRSGPTRSDPLDELRGSVVAVGVGLGLEVVGAVCWVVVAGAGLVVVAGAVSDTESRAG